MIASQREQMVDLLSRHLEDGQVVCTGINSEIPLAACMLARQTHAPTLTVLAGGVFVNPSRLPKEFCAGWDAGAEYVGDMSDLYSITEAGIDVVFYSGLQIDRFGNINMHRIVRDNRLIRQGPGVANTSFGHTARKVLLWTEHHTHRQLRHDVDFYSIVGHNMRGQGRGELGLGNDGPQALVTPDVEFRPNSEMLFEPYQRLSDRAWVDVVDDTGWPIPSEPPGRRGLIDSERLDVLRRVIDPSGILRG